MSNSKSNQKDIIISRVTVTFFVYSLLSLFAWLYILPFKKSYLIINNYYQYIEMSIIAITFILSVLSIINYIRHKKMSYDAADKVITPSMLVLYALSTFIGAFLIPISNNRTLLYKYCIAAFMAIFIAYATYYLINKGFICYTSIATIYCVIFAFLDYMYTDNITFSDKIPLTYTGAAIIIFVVIVAITFLFFVLSRKIKFINWYNVLAFSVIAFIALTVRIFWIKYVSFSAIILEILTFIFIAVKEKKGIKFKK